jgi:hypothetical protein
LKIVFLVLQLTHEATLRFGPKKKLKDLASLGLEICREVKSSSHQQIPNRSENLIIVAEADSQAYTQPLLWFTKSKLLVKFVRANSMASPKAERTGLFIWYGTGLESNPSK